MKKLSLLFALVALTLFVACNGGDDPVKTSLELEGETYTDISGYFDDYGTRYYGQPMRSDVSEIPDTHRLFSIVITDGEPQDSEDCYPPDFMETFYLWLTLFSPDIDEDSFVNGEYSFSFSQEIGDRTGEKFGHFENGSFDDTETYYSDAEGTVTISGSFPNVTAKVDLDIYYYSQSVRGEGEPDMYHTLTGTFKGELVEHSLCD